jgi:protein-L-isoaspartate(D-aspartate) O-methyltransferase
MGNDDELSGREAGARPLADAGRSDSLLDHEPPDPVSEAHLQAHRAAYARRITAQAGLDPRISPGSEILAAFASVPRERFLGPPPWKIHWPGNNRWEVTGDPAALYQDVLVSLGAGDGLNNGQPTLHTHCLAELVVRKGENVVHVGAGTGYYTAILALLVGEAGRVDAFEIEPELAARAQASLAGFAQIEVHGRSGAEAPLPKCDVIYVNAAATEPLVVWLDALRIGGRLLFPLSPGSEGGEMLLVTRRDGEAWEAKFLGSVQFVPCIGAQDERAAQALAAAFRRGDVRRVCRLHRNSLPDASCWLAGQGWWLSMG